MSRQMLSYALLMLLGVFISSVAQVMLKKASQREYASVWKEYLNVFVISAYAIFFAATFLSIFAYRVIPLSLGVILETTGYLYITVFSITVFHEKIEMKKLAALGLIVLGIVIYAVSG